MLRRLDIALEGLRVPGGRPGEGEARSLYCSARFQDVASATRIVHAPLSNASWAQTFSQVVGENHAEHEPIVFQLWSVVGGGTPGAGNGNRRISLLAETTLSISSVTVDPQRVRDLWVPMPMASRQVSRALCELHVRLLYVTIDLSRGYSGTLRRQQRVGLHAKRWSVRHSVVLAGTLYYGKTADRLRAMSLHRASVTAVPAPDASGPQHCLRVSASAGETLVFACDTAEESAVWLQRLREASQHDFGADLVAASPSFASPASSGTRRSSSSRRSARARHGSKDRSSSSNGKSASGGASVAAAAGALPASSVAAKPSAKPSAPRQGTDASLASAGSVPAPPPSPTLSSHTLAALSKEQQRAYVDPFGADVGQEPGIEVWRVDALKLKRIPPKQHGDFYSGDAYVVLCTKQRWDSDHDLEYAVHYWLGETSSQDEQVAAALYALGLDKVLQRRAAQYREVQGHESDVFLSYFAVSGLCYLEGGMASSGLRPVQHEPVRLWQVKGVRHVRIRAVEVSGKSLNSGDVFILQAQRAIYQWNGRDANKYERVKGLSVATKLRNDERHGRAELIVLEESDPDTDADVVAFWALLGGRVDVASASHGGDDEVFERSISYRLYRISEGKDGRLAIKRVPGTPLRRHLLPDHAYILDCGCELFVWVGPTSNLLERRAAMSCAEEFITATKLPRWTPIMRVLAGSETTLFKEKFPDWTEKVLTPSDYRKIITPRIARRQSQLAIDVGALHKMPASPQMRRGASLLRVAVDDTEPRALSDAMDVVMLDGDALVPIPPEEHQQFFSGQSYAVLYTYQAEAEPGAPIVTKAVMYLWQGADAPVRDFMEFQFSYRSLLAELLRRRGATKDPVQARVVQLKEPAHFLALFDNAIVVHAGRRDSEQPATRLYHVRSNFASASYCVQVAATASSLNSRDAFLLLTGEACVVWHGRGASTADRSAATAFADDLAGSRKRSAVAEGKESASFWSSLGGRSEYADADWLAKAPPRPPRLFHMSNSSGVFRVKEVHNFTQDDLDASDVMLLDAWDEVFVWVGRFANEAEKAAAWTTAQRYVDSAPHRSHDLPLVRVDAGNEPLVFTCHFVSWDAAKARAAVAEYRDPYEEKLRLLRQERRAKGAAALKAARAKSGA